MKRIRAVAILLAIIMIFSFGGCSGWNQSIPSTDIYTDAEQQDSISGDTSNEIYSQDESDSNKAFSRKQVSSKASSKKSATPNAVSVKEIIPRKKQAEYYTLNGRAFFSDSMTIKLPYSCSSVEFTLECQGNVVMNFTIENRTVWVDIYIDDKIVDGGRTAIKKSGDYTVATGLQEGNHTFKIVRQTEVEAGALALKQVRAGNAKLCAVKETGERMLIEAIGDTALVGYGVLLNDDFFSSSQYSFNIAKSGENQNGLLTYPSLAADTLNADCTIMARQGVGIATSYHDDMDIGRLNGFYRYYDINSKATYDFSRQADIIVVDGGSTDVIPSLLKKVSHNGKQGLSTDDAVDISVEFFRMLKENNPNAKIIWCYGLINESMDFEIHMNKVIKALGGEREDYYTLKLEKTTRGSFPSKGEHKNAAKLLVNKIKEIM